MGQRRHIGSHIASQNALSGHLPPIITRPRQCRSTRKLSPTDFRPVRAPGVFKLPHQKRALERALKRALKVFG
jgi:hypothetical protein